MCAQRLEYASANLTRKPWGPFVVKPSRRSLLLILLSLAAAAWLTARHQPWTLTALVRSSGNYWQQTRFEFTPTNRLVICDEVAQIWDADTGRILHQIGKSEIGKAYGPLTFNHATEILLLQRGWRTTSALVYDIDSGALLKEIPLTRDGTGDCQLIAAAPTGHRLLIRRNNVTTSPSPTLTTEALSLWDIDAPASAAKPLEPIATLPFNGPAQFSPDGRRIAVFEPRLDYGRDIFDLPFSGGFAGLDASTGTPLFINRPPRNGYRRFAFSSDSSRIILESADYLNTHTRINAVTGQPLGSFTCAGATRSSISPDGQRVALIQFNSARELELSILDVTAGTASVRPLGYYPDQALLTFFPDSRRLLAPGDEYRSLAIYDTASLKPRALLRNQIGDLADIAVSPDATRIATRDRSNTITFYRKTGLDCPESRWGALAFPHLWLLVALATAAAFSLRRDADHASADLTLPVARFALVLFLITLPRTLHLIVATCIGERFLTPAPLLLLASIGLATGSRFWRLLTLTALAAALPVDLYCLYLLKHIGFTTTTDMRLFDRWYAIPNLAAFITLALFTALIPFGIYALSRRPK
jgi:WD40 repeat protein